jgi:hypothetical protein
MSTEFSNKVSVKGISPYGANGFSFTVRIQSQWAGTDLTQDYRTNYEGDGLFVYDGSGKQLTGTCQFSLAGCKTDGARRKRIVRWFE